MGFLNLFKNDKFFSIKNPTKKECEAMLRIRNKIKEANLTFDPLACIELTRVFNHYKIETLIKDINRDEK